MPKPETLQSHGVEMELSYVDMHMHMLQEESMKMSELFAVGSISMELVRLRIRLVEYFGFFM